MTTPVAMAVSLSVRPTVTRVGRDRA